MEFWSGIFIVSVNSYPVRGWVTPTKGAPMVEGAGVGAGRVVGLYGRGAVGG